jgi:hypothetical protein
MRTLKYTGDTEVDFSKSLVIRVNLNYRDEFCPRGLIS